MVSKNDPSPFGRSYHHMGGKGSMRLVRVGSRSFPVYSLVIVCLVLLNVILLLTAVVVGINCESITDFPQNDLMPQVLKTEVEQLRRVMSETAQDGQTQQDFVKEHMSNQQIKLQLESNKTHNDELQKQLELLQAERAALQSNTSDIVESCGLCMPGWFLSNTSCYFYGKRQFNKGINWTTSREDCIRRGADLAVFDTVEEHIMVFERLPKVKWGTYLWGIGGLWIGLTDHQREGTWKWINNATLNYTRFWMDGEPNNHWSAEHCVGLMNTDKGLKSLFDARCESHREYLCEKKLS
ncbi:CD209 antigen-like protein E [Oryzias melastigma]|uniref:CD209 antigen-like protein E n=1 Tax=Oryzias melastigma TaxID=30732 RepID=UPI00168CC247|nr:CD209 antigen-like protein E [Oryzias melastigma]